MLRCAVLRHLLPMHGCTATPRLHLQLQLLVTSRLVTQACRHGDVRYSSRPYFKPLVYGLMDIVSASGIVFANKTVFAV
jgi:hypothetical protein